jgi:hypothetical protein
VPIIQSEESESLVAAYFLILHDHLFMKQMRPVLAASWRRRSFEPCREFCASLLPQVEEFDSLHHIREGVPLVRQIVEGLGFHRDYWRTLVGELLFYAAEEIPEFQTCLDTLRCLLAPGHDPHSVRAPIEQAHLGSHQLTFGAATYRPDHCGLNECEDVCRLAPYLSAVDPAAWQADSLTLVPEEEREEELAIARDWFVPLRAMYERAAQAGQVIIHEIL